MRWTSLLARERERTFLSRTYPRGGNLERPVELIVGRHGEVQRRDDVAGGYRAGQRIAGDGAAHLAAADASARRAEGARNRRAVLRELGMNGDRLAERRRDAGPFAREIGGGARRIRAGRD